MASVRAVMSAARGKLVNPAPEIIAEIGLLQRGIALRAVEKLKEYPNELENQRYVRTFMLKRSWRINGPRFTPSSGVTTSVTNTVTDRQGKHYASLVQGKDQKLIHQGRWLRVDEAMASERGSYRVGIAAVLKRHGLR